MLVSSETFPLDSVVMTNRSFSRVRPATLSGHGSSRCHARLRWSTSSSAIDVMPAAPRSSSRIMRCRSSIRVHGSSPRAHPVHRRGIAGAPAIGHRRPIGVDAVAPGRTSSSSRMMLERQSTTVPNTSNANACGTHHGSSTTLPSTPPSARLCNAALPSASGYRIGGGGRSPAFTSSATPNSNTDCDPGLRLTYSP